MLDRTRKSPLLTKFFDSVSLVPFILLSLTQIMFGNDSVIINFISQFPEQIFNTELNAHVI